MTSRHQAHSQIQSLASRESRFGRGARLIAQVLLVSLPAALLTAQAGRAQAETYEEYLAAQKKPAPKSVTPAKTVAPKAVTPAKTVAKPVAPPEPLPQALQKAESIREAANLLEKAWTTLGRGNRNLAEQLFSSSELIVGPDALADVAMIFRAGAPPRINTPLKVLPLDTPPQPTSVGGSDQDDPDKKPARGSLTGNVSFVSGTTSSLAVVTLTPTSGKAKSRVAKQRTIEQRGREFAPHVLAVPVGSTVTFPNFDPTFHNVFSTSEARAFDLGLYRNGETREVTFDREGVIRLGCNLHANMSAYIVVVSAPHYAITDSSGAFRFGSIAPGKYTLRVWNERSRAPTEQSVVIRSGENQLSAKVADDGAPGPLPDKFGASRGGS